MDNGGIDIFAKNNKVALIDADFFMYYVCPNKKDAEPKTKEDCIKLVDSFMTTIFTLTRATHYLLFLTVGRCFRYTIYPDYKGNRKRLEKPPHFDYVKEYLITKYHANYNMNLEADDLVVCYKKLIPNSFIISPDKDILKCIEGTHYNPKENKFITTSFEDSVITFWKSMIIGDTADNIKGIPGKGEKAAEEIFKDIKCPPARVLKNYIEHFGVDVGIEEFYKNYKLLKILESYEGLETLEPIEVDGDTI